LPSFYPDKKEAKKERCSAMTGASSLFWFIPESKNKIYKKNGCAMKKENAGLPKGNQNRKKSLTSRKLLCIVLLIPALLYATSWLTDTVMDRVHEKEFLKYTEQNAQYLQDLLFKKSIHDTVVHLGVKNSLVRQTATGQSPADSPEVTNLLSYIREITSAEWVSIFDRKGTIIAAAVEENYGQNILGKDFSDREYFQGAIQGKTVVYPRLGHGSSAPGLHYVAPIWNTAGASADTKNIVGVVGIKLNQEKLIESFFNTCNDSIMLVSSEGEIVFSNHPEWVGNHISHCDPNQPAKEYYTASDKTLCYSLLTVKTKSTPLVFPAENYMIFQYPLQSMRDNQGPWSLYQIRHAQGFGTYIAIALANLFVLITYGTILLTLRLRGERKRSLQNRLDQEQKLRQILNDNPVATYMIDRDHKVSYWNKAVENLTGVHEELIVGTDRHRQIFPSKEDRTLADMVLDNLSFSEMELSCGGSLRQSPLAKGAFEREVQLPAPGHSATWLTISAAPAHDSSGRTVGVIESLQDITALVKTKEQAQEANRAKSELMANMSQEIRTPMTTMLGFTDLLQTTELTKEQFEYVSIIQKSGKTLLNMIDCILDFSRIESGTLWIENAEFDLEQMAREIESLMYPVAVQKKLDFKVIHQRPLPVKMISDRNRIHQCLLNLVNNAIKFTEKGSVQLTLSAEKQTHGVWVRFEVQDTGVGIPEDKQNSVFEAFTQTDNSMTRKYSGTGLGLNITRKLVHQMGGSIEIASVAGQGSIFTLLLPAGVDSFEQAQTHTLVDSPETHRMEETKYSGRVLIVEDNPTNQLLVQTLLNKLDVQTVLAIDGIEAVEKAEATSFDLILMDIQMPNLNGLQATQIMRKKGLQTPIVALTAHAMESDRQKCLDAGCDGYLSKPVDRNKLMGMLDKYLSSPSEPLTGEIEKLCEETEELTDLCRQTQQPDQPKTNESAKTSTPEQQ
jgi:signal transduction histidine kinase/CheY-like chemotaxis protein